MNDDKAKQKLVEERYGAVARSGLTNDSEAVRTVATSFGYTADELASIPAEANMGLSCGNPVALAALRDGEVVVDLGSGGGLDVFLAAKKVGPKGRAIGIDMTADMIRRARAAAEKSGIANVEFHLAEIDRLPLADASVDCVLSNCVINLVPEKARVFREIYRILKPGGRVAISDIALRKPLPPERARDLEAYVGCVAGAVLIADYERLVREAGFETVLITDSGADLNVYAKASGSGCCTPGGGCTSDAKPATAVPSVHDGLASVLAGFDANAYAASVRVHAVKAAPAASKPPLFAPGKTSTKVVEVYDKPMCCSTGVCGPEVDPVLPRFAADLDWLESLGHRVERRNLAQEPAAFVGNPAIKELLAKEGTEALPAIVVDGRIVSRGGYPSRQLLGLWVGAGEAATSEKPAGEKTCCGPECCN